MADEPKTNDATEFITCRCGHTADQHRSPGNIGNLWAVHPLLGRCNGCDCERFQARTSSDGFCAIMLRNDGDGLRFLFPHGVRARVFIWLAQRLPWKRALFWVLYGMKPGYASWVEGEW